MTPHRFDFFNYGEFQIIGMDGKCFIKISREEEGMKRKWDFDYGDDKTGIVT
jgi:hypothetical protein